MSGEYSREQIEKMQKDAERRVMEMQRRSKGAMEKEGASFGRQPSSGSRFSGGHNYGGRSSDTRTFDKQGQGKDCSDPRPSSKNYGSCSLPGLSEKPRLLELLNINKLLNDPDDRLVLLLIALLSGEKADPLLLLSLLYIIL